MNLPGLLRVPTEELTALLRSAHRGTLTTPLSRATLLASGHRGLAEHGDALFGLDERAVRAVLVCVLAERRAAAAGTQRDHAVTHADAPDRGGC